MCSSNDFCEIDECTATVLPLEKLGCVQRILEGQKSSLLDVLQIGLQMYPVINLPSLMAEGLLAAHKNLKLAYWTTASPYK